MVAEGADRLCAKSCLPACPAVLPPILWTRWKPLAQCVTEVQDAQAIINVARRLSDEGAMVLAGRGGGDFVDPNRP